MASSAKAKGQKIICVNRKASHNYTLDKKIEAGICLKGSEVKSCRDSKVQLLDSYAYFEGAELYLMKAHISEYKQGGPFFNHDVTRKRKLLLKNVELKRLKMAIEAEGFALIPTKMYFSAGKVKVEIALAKGKNKGDKRQTLKDKTEKRQIQRQLKINR